MMKAAIVSHYGAPSVAHVSSVAKPLLNPDGTQVLIKVKCTTVSSGDARVRGSNFPPGFTALARLGLGVLGPRTPILGTEFAGDVVAVGAKVSKFKVGDAVVGGRTFLCHAEYLVMDQDDAICLKPAAMSYQVGTCIAFGGNTALCFLRDQAHLTKGEKVLVNGASGSVGSAAVQLAKHFGAEVTAVCSSANADLVRSMGATHVLDYTKVDFAAAGTKYDVILDTTGNATFARCKSVLNPGGRLCAVASGLWNIVFRPMFGTKTVCAGVTTPNAANMRFLVDLVESGEFRPHVDRQFSLSEIVDAYVYVDAGHKKGNVVVNVS